MAWKDTFTQVGLGTELARDRAKIENILLAGIYGDALKRIRDIERLIQKHGKTAISDEWDSITTTTMINIYEAVRSFLVNMESNHDDPSSDDYVNTIADLPS